MNRLAATIICVLFLPVDLPAAQSPSGRIAGVVTDSSGGAVAEAEVGITNQDSGQRRTFMTSSAGTYSASALPPGEYTVAIQAAGFKGVARTAVVETGTTTTIDVILELGEVRDTVTISAAVPLLRNDHQVSGVISRPQIENLPLNGRNFLDLVALEPGVTPPVRGTNNRVFVAALGSGLQTNPRVGYTRVTVDGGNINSVGAIGASLQVSQDVVQEFQLSTVNFDLSTGLTSNGSINIVTRSGGNDFHGSAFYFYRDHHLAAYPGLRRDPENPHPPFERHQLGYHHSGPLRRDRLFFFTDYERTNQEGVVSVQPRTPEFAALGGIFRSPYSGDQFSARADLRITARHNAFVRYTLDSNRAFAPLNDRVDLLPSGWSRFANRSDQTLAAFTSVLSSAVVSDLRLSYFFLDSLDEPGGPEECGGCFGLGVPRINIPDAGLMFGNPRTVSVRGGRYQLTENVTWQKNRHLFRFGFDWEHATSTGSSLFQDPAQLTLWSPAQARQAGLAFVLPASFTSVDDVLGLPLQRFSTGVGPGVILQRGFRSTRVFDLYRLYGSDTWRIGSRLTINYGLAWSYEPNVLNHDLTKPALLIPILGHHNLKPPAAEGRRFSPTAGFAWSATDDGRTVVRAGAGRYFDPIGSTNPLALGNERSALLPLGTGRAVVPGSSISCDGRVLDFPRPTSFTGVQSLACLPDIREALLASLNPDNRDFSVRNIDRYKVGQNLIDPFFSTPSAVHVGVGVQRQIARDFAISADFVWRQFAHTFVPGIDYNRWNSVDGPIIRPCASAERNDVQAACSNGSITFDATIGRARYKGLLVRADKRLSRRTQFLASYAFGGYVGTNGTEAGAGFNNDDWFENYGPVPTDLRHVLNASGYIELPWQFQLAFSVTAQSRPPLSAVVSGVDFNGDGTRSDLLPGSSVNQLNRGLDGDDLARLVANYSEQVAGKPLCCNQGAAPAITLPASYSFGDPFFTQDIRLSRTFALGDGGARVQLLGEVFNLFNTANLIQYGDNIANSATFGQPGARFAQVFGSGGPRAAQLGVRVSF